MKSVQFHFQAIKLLINFLSQGKFLWFFAPGLLIAIIYFFLTYDLNQLASQAINTEELSWFSRAFDWGKSTFFGIFQFIGEQIYVFFILTLLSPFNTILSEKVDTEMTGTTFSFNIFQVISDLIRMIFVVILSIVMELIVIFFYFIISWIFGLDVINGVMYFLIASFFYGISFYDYSLERYKKDTLSTFGFAFSKMLMVICTGAIFQLIYWIPFLGIPLSPVIATIIATIVYIYQQKIPLKNDRASTELS